MINIYIYIQPMIKIPQWQLLMSHLSCPWWHQEGDWFFLVLELVRGGGPRRRDARVFRNGGYSEWHQGTRNEGVNHPKYSLIFVDIGWYWLISVTRYYISYKQAIYMFKMEIWSAQIHVASRGCCCLPRRPFLVAPIILKQPPHHLSRNHHLLRNQCTTMSMVDTWLISGLQMVDIRYCQPLFIHMFVCTNDSPQHHRGSPPSSPWFTIVDHHQMVDKLVDQ